LIIDALKQSQVETTKVVAAWGDTATDDTEGWITKLCHPNNCIPQSCISDVQTQFVSGVHFEIFYQLTGNVMNPQAKVLFGFI